MNNLRRGIQIFQLGANTIRLVYIIEVINHLQFGYVQGYYGFRDEIYAKNIARPSKKNNVKRMYVCMYVILTSACRKNKCSFGNSNDNRYI